MSKFVVIVTVAMPPELENDARIEAVRRQISRSELIRQAVKLFLAQERGDRR